MSSETNIATVRQKLKYCCDFKIYIEKVIRKTVGTQCHNCQRYGHSSTNCRASGHKTIEETPVCVNCKLNHVASYKGCIAFTQYNSKIKSTRQTSSINNRTNNPYQHTSSDFPSLFPTVPANKFSSNLSYSKVVNNNNNNNYQHNFLLNEIQNLFGENMSSFFPKLNHFINSYQQITDTLHKKIAMLDFLASLNNNVQSNKP